MTRAAFAREALRKAARLETAFDENELDRRHREGYERIPVHPGEFDVSDAERAWGD